MLNLTAEEQAWLNEYRHELLERFLGNVEDVVIFGSKARGDDGPDSDVDVLLVLREGGRQIKKDARLLGHRLAAGSDVVASILVYTNSEWEERAKGGSPLYRAVMRDGIHVL